MEMKKLNGITAIIPLTGNLSADLEETLKSEYTEAEREGLHNIILDFRLVDHMDIEGLTALVILAFMADRMKLVTCTYGLSKRYREIFQMCSISESYPDYEAIRKSVIMLSEPENRLLEKTDEPVGRQDDSGWAPYIEKIELKEKPAGANARNMHGKKVYGPLKGFGHLWLKIYSITIPEPTETVSSIMDILKSHFSEFHITNNKFFPSSKGFQPGECVLLDARTPGGIISTGVLVLYSDDSSFALMTPGGHPEAGWVSFTTTKKDDSIVVKINGLARSSDPFYEIGFRMIGARLQEYIWSHVLIKLARHIGVDDKVRLQKIIIDKALHWDFSGNLKNNAQIRSLHLNPRQYFSSKWKHTA